MLPMKEERNSINIAIKQKALKDRRQRAME
jgi:hypothetical protein